LKKIIVALCFVQWISTGSGFAQTNVSKTEEINMPLSELKIKMVSIPEGSFLMGSNSSTKPTEKPAKTVKVSAFWMGAFEITHDQFDVFLAKQQYIVKCPSFSD
jgi:formylglycine-generating enzyme required for sulfatase activity